MEVIGRGIDRLGWDGNVVLFLVCFLLLLKLE